MLGIFLDTETNGLSPVRHKVIEIAFNIVDLETGLERERYESLISQTEDEWKSSDCQSLEINGFTLDDVKRGQSSAKVSEEIQNCFSKCGVKRGSSLFICQNPSFDRPFFSQIISTEIQEKKLWPYHWLDLASMHFAISLFKKKTDPKASYPWEAGLSKDTIAKLYNLPAENKPHRAMNGVDHLILCYKAVVGFPLSS